MTDAALDEITVPALFVHHRYDACVLTPYGAIARVMASMKKAKKVELITIEGGENLGNPCTSGYHQYLGIEDEVTRQIADWIKRAQREAGGSSGSASRSPFRWRDQSATVSKSAPQREM